MLNEFNNNDHRVLLQFSFNNCKGSDLTNEPFKNTEIKY
jgi:hypothetical protein